VSCEANEQSRATGRGVGGAKGGGRGECEPAKHAPGTVPGARVTSAGAHTARRENIAKRRQSPEVGAVCLNWARTDLCGGREVTRVPTAIVPMRGRHVQESKRDFVKFPVSGVTNKQNQALSRLLAAVGESRWRQFGRLKSTTSQKAHCAARSRDARCRTRMIH
jgi:hypothetical protein